VGNIRVRALARLLAKLLHASTYWIFRVEEPTGVQVNHERMNQRNTNVSTLPESSDSSGGAWRAFAALAARGPGGAVRFGAYLIEDQFTNPLASQSLSLFAAAVLLASAMAMLYELIQLPRSTWVTEGGVARRLLSTAAEAEPAGEQVVCAAKHLNMAPVRVVRRKDLAVQRCYVDSVRVRA
jgi:hypothetical protein